MERVVLRAGAWLLLLVLLSSVLASGQARYASRRLPDKPSGVVAVPISEGALVAWLVPPAAEDILPITAYTVTAYETTARKPVSTAKAGAPGVVLNGLRGNHCYIFSVHATNGAGDSQESDPSEIICPIPPPGADLQVTMSAELPPGAPGVIFTIVVTNNGVEDAAMVNLTDTLPAPLSSFTTTQGICQGSPGTISLRCNLGALHNGESATVTATVMVTNAEITNTASVTAHDSNGALLADPVPENNSATATARTSSGPDPSEVPDSD